MPATPARFPGIDSHGEFDQVAEVLDPVLTSLGFAPGQAGAFEGKGQVIFCRGEWEGTDCGGDLVIDIEATPEWRIIDVRYWGFPSDRWHLEFDQRVDLSEQLAGLARSLPNQIA